jgi:hypothetical protein
LWATFVDSAFLEEAGLVHHQHPVRVAEALDGVAAYVVAQRIGVQRALVNNRCRPSE